MTALKLPKRYHPDFRVAGKKPVGRVEVDFNNPLTQGLASVIDVATGRDLLTSEQGIPSGGDLSFNSVGRLGKASIWDNSPSSVSQIEMPSNKLPDANNIEFTIFCDMVPFGAAIDASSIYATASGTDAVQSLQFRWNSIGRLQVVRPGAYVHTTSNNSVTYNKRQKVAVSFMRNLRSDYYFDGVKDSVTPSNAVVSEGSNETSIGANFNDSQYNARGELYLILVWRRGLTDAEHLSLADNPYQIFKPANDFPYLVSAAPANPSITASRIDEGDTLSALLQVVPKVTAARVDEGDLISASLQTGSTVTASRIDEGDGAAASIQSAVSLSASRTDDGDAISASLQVALSLSASRTDAGDSIGAALQSVSSLSAIRTDEGDTIAADLTGVLTASVTAARVDSGDSVSAALGVAASMSASRLDSGDAISAQIQGVSLSSITAFRIDDGDTISAAFELGGALITASRIDQGDAIFALLGSDVLKGQGVMTVTAAYNGKLTTGSYSFGEITVL